ncbi:hypothetical protein E3E31_12020 [Thermococcus sp. M39]|uniref:hypothetical protein n=1 Tax=Thermococcus sp. M39 TaxID=1638262 RepID=UPI00143B5DB8|nr:hypothetical protein [Thermococcus sp. M39]NJE09234.1 hypothetical protein [Thermococcus sp. M39]
MLVEYLEFRADKVFIAYDEKNEVSALIYNQSGWTRYNLAKLVIEKAVDAKKANVVQDVKFEKSESIVFRKTVYDVDNDVIELLTLVNSFNFRRFSNVTRNMLNVLTSVKSDAYEFNELKEFISLLQRVDDIVKNNKNLANFLKRKKFFEMLKSLDDRLAFADALLLARAIANKDKNDVVNVVKAVVSSYVMQNV